MPLTHRTTGGNRRALKSPWRALGEREIELLELAGEAWREVSDKLLPFVDGSDGYNWLTNEGDVKVLISRDGTW